MISVVNDIPLNHCVGVLALAKKRRDVDKYRSSCSTSEEDFGFVYNRFIGDR